VIIRGQRNEIRQALSRSSDRIFLGTDFRKPVMP
jgi:hypothetical protein